MAKQERAVRTRNALIESAAELFTRDGFELASLAGISSRAGVSNGALHFHFASKAALAAAVGRAAAERFDRMTSAERPLPQYGGSLQALVDASHALLDGLAHDVVLRAASTSATARRWARGSRGRTCTRAGGSGWSGPPPEPGGRRCWPVTSSPATWRPRSWARRSVSPR